MDMSITLERHVSHTAWYGYSIRLTDDEIRQRFETRYGYAPSELLRNSAIVLAGPVIKETTDESTRQD